MGPGLCPDPPPVSSRTQASDGNEVRGRIAACLEDLYGPQTAVDLLPRVLALAERYADLLPAPITSGWSEEDAILITYPDQVYEPGQAPLASLADFCRHHLKGLVSGIHLLPFYPSSSDDGFSVVDYRQVDPAYGTWDDVQRLSREWQLMFDAVINHASVRSAWFQAFLRQELPYAGYFLTPPPDADLLRVVRPRTSPLLTSFPTAAGERRVWTTFSADQADLNYRDPNLLLEILDVLLGYVQRGATLLRLDAVAFLWKEPGTSCLHLPQTHAIIRLIRALLDLAAPHVLLVTEANVPHADNLTYFGDGRDEAQMVYNFALPPLVLDAIACGSAEDLSRWAARLETPGERTTFFNFLASHDGIGLNPACGLIPEARLQALVERTRAYGGQVSMKSGPGGAAMPYELNINYFDALSDPHGTEPLARQVDRFLVAHAVMLALSGVPGIYFHSLLGSRGWPEGVQQTGQPRAINRQKLDRRVLDDELRQGTGRRAQVFRRFAGLLRARRSVNAFHPDASQTVLDLGESVFGLIRVARQTGEPVVCLHNLGARAVACPPIAPGGPGRSRPWMDLIAARLSRDLSQGMVLAPYQVAWFVPAHGTQVGSGARRASSPRVSEARGGIG